MSFIATVKDSSPSNMLPAGKAGAVFAVGAPVYLDSNGVYQKAAASLLTVAPASRLFAIGFCAQVAQANEVINAYRKLNVSDTALTLTVGAPVYLSSTAGGLTQTSPDATYAQQIVGVATSAIDISLNASANVSSISAAVQRTGTSQGALTLNGTSYLAEAPSIQAIINEFRAALVALGIIRGS
jgi:hypothetical protein